MKEEDYPFRRYRIKMGNSRHTYLTPEEMKSLEVLELTGEYRVLQHTFVDSNRKVYHDNN